MCEASRINNELSYYTKLYEVRRYRTYNSYYNYYTNEEDEEKIGKKEKIKDIFEESNEENELYAYINYKRINKNYFRNEKLERDGFNLTNLADKNFIRGNAKKSI